MNNALKPVGQQIAEGDFSRNTKSALKKMGVALIGVQWLPGDGPMPMANGERGYIVNDNGTQRTLTFSKVMAMSARLS